MDRQKQLGKEDVTKLLIKFSIPAIIGMIVNGLYNIIDRAYIGHIKDVGSLAITGVGITLPIVTIMLAFSMLIGVGGSAVISIKLGQKKKCEAQKVLGNSFILIIISSLIIGLLGVRFIDTILSLLGTTNATYTYAKEYIVIILFGYITNSIGFAMNNFIRAEGNPKIAMITMLLGAILNTVLDPIFIFVFNLGIKGAAIATLISQTVSSIWVMMYFIGDKNTLSLQKKYFKLEFQIIKEIISIGMAPFLIQLAASVVIVVFNNELRKAGGDLAIGAMTVINSINLLILMPIFGINQGAQPIIGYNFGAKKHQRVKSTLKLAILYATLIALLGFVLVEFFPAHIIKIFNKDTSLLNIGVKGLRIFLCMLPIIGFQIVSSNYFQAIGQAKIAVFLSLLRQVIVLIPLLIILPKFLGLTGIWLSGPISDIISSIITFIFLIKEKIFSLKFLK